MNPKSALRKYLEMVIVGESDDKICKDYARREAAILMAMMDLIQDAIDDRNIRLAMEFMGQVEVKW